MNFLTSIVRRAIRKPLEPINVLVVVDGFNNRDILEDSNIYLYKNVLPHVEYDLVISDDKNLDRPVYNNGPSAAQFATNNHLFLLKSDVLHREDLEQIIREHATKPYLNHPYI